MEGLIVLAIIFFLILPIFSAIMLHGLRERLSNLEKLTADVKSRIASLDNLVRQGLPEKSSEAAEPLPSTETPSENAKVFGTDELAVEKPQEVPAAGDTPLPPREEPAGETAARAQLRPAVKPAEAKDSWLAMKCREFFAWLFTEGNIWVTVGVILFLAGFALLFNYVHRRGWIPLEFRLIGAAAAGIAMTAFGWRLRKSRRTYALILQGGGIGVLYTVLVAGAKLGSVVPVGGAVVGMLLLSAFTIVLALYQEFEPLVLFALLGGYAAPILMSTGSQNFIVLFSIHSLLNFEVFLISLFRDWRKTRWGGLIASCAAGAVWGALKWRASYFASVEPFLILFFVNYSMLAMIPLYSNKLSKFFKNVRFRQYERVDTPLIAAVPWIFLFLQMSAASHTRYGVAATCLALGAWHLALGKMLMKRERVDKIDCPHQLFFVYCVLFSNLAIPFVFKQASSSAIWAVEGAFLIAFAARKEKSDALVCGLLLHLAALVLYNYGPYLHLPSSMYAPLLGSAGLLDWRGGASPFLLTGLIFAVSSLVSSYFISRGPACLPPSVRFRGRLFGLPRPDLLSSFFALYGTVWWTFSVWHAVFAEFAGSRATAFTAFSVLCLGGAAGYALSSYPGRKAVGGGTGTSPALNWNAARILALPPLAIAFVGVLTSLDLSDFRYLYELGNQVYLDLWSSYALNWSAFAAMFIIGAMSYRSASPTGLRVVTWGIFLFTFVSYTAAVWSVWTDAAFPQVWRGPGGISDFFAFLPLFCATALLTLERFRRKIALEPYFKSSMTALCVLMLLRFPAFFHSFRVSENIPSFYIPLLNTLELWQFLYLAAAAMLSRMILNERARKNALPYALTFAVFLWLNDVAARASLRCFGERISWGYMSGAPHFQGIIAILWGTMSFACIFGGKKYASRPLWFTGAGLLVLDILKLLTIDLGNSATVIRICAFLLLGGFFLFIGWAAPLPPADPLRKKPGGDKM
jgi:uncharacterized membrane protein